MYSGGPACLYGGGPSTFTIKTWCDPNLAVEDTIYSGFIGNDDVCNAYVEITSSIGACDIFSNSILWEYLGYVEPYIGVIGIIGGVVLAFYGFRLLRPSIFMVGFLSCCLLSMLIFYAVYVDSVDELTAFYVWLACGAGAGIVVGYILQKAVKVGAMIVGGWGGFVVGLILNETIMYRFEYVWMFWTTNLVSIFVCAYLAYKVFDHVFIFSTSVVGSFFLARGISVYAGHYYNEFVIIKMLKSGLIDEIDPFYWAYVGGFVAVSAISMWYQFRLRPRPKPSHPYHH